ncbi:hypothetical protein [Mesorhizobium sp. M7A.F.Ca.CA.004.11.1.1]|uniref:hypothetical protein n=1 Tax=Mesorhizobium sp. M7A.F.Ca.CA.004.11.1.1 TaxID=2496698 RepID=UPI001FDF1515|nr:hypothetical protein [Mesorhizobium sp. M7A.F.Ca.CA.004.11.1.1]
MNIFDDPQRLRRLAQEATEYTDFNRRTLLKSVGGLIGGAALASTSILASAEEITPPAAGKKVRIGVPLTYGPFNQPWRRGCWQIVKAVLDAGGGSSRFAASRQSQANSPPSGRCSTAGSTRL